LNRHDLRIAQHILLRKRTARSDHRGER